MCVFIAGKRRTGTKEGKARRSEVCGGISGKRVREQRERTMTLSQMPCVIFASVLAEQGATRTISAQRRSCRDGQDLAHATGRGRAHLDM